MAGTTAATVAAYTAVAASAAGAAMSTYTGYKSAKTQQAVNKYNAQEARNTATRAQMEKSVTVDAQRDKALRAIAAGRAAMSSSGNVGSSADNTVYSAYLNLDKDIANLNYNYDSMSASAKKQADPYNWYAGISGDNAINNLVGGSLQTIGALASGLWSVSKIAPGAMTSVATDTNQVLSANNAISVSKSSPASLYGSFKV